MASKPERDQENLAAIRQWQETCVRATSSPQVQHLRYFGAFRRWLVEEEAREEEHF